MNLESRTKNTIRNIKFSIINQVVNLLFAFMVRTVFVKELGVEYLGINALFANIITLLSLADLGITSAISYSLYEPLSNRDTEKINLLMKFYKKIYYTISLVVIIIGIALIPFLKFIIKDFTYNRGIILIYLIFVLDSGLSYLFAYKRCLIISDQKNYIINKINNLFFILLSLLQIGILLYTKNYILYLLVRIITNILQNLYIQYVANKMYPFITVKNDKNIEKSILKEIGNNILGSFFYRIADVISNGTDNIVLSSYLGVSVVGIYSNYMLISNSINGILYYIFDSMTATLGNLVVSENNKKSYSMFKFMNFMNFWLFGVCFICISILINPFIKIWIGDEYVFNLSTVMVICMNFYITGMRNTPTLFRKSYGLLSNGKKIPLIMASLNLILSIVFVKLSGINGVIIGTILSTLITYSWYDPYILLKIKFKQSFFKYLVTNIFYAGITLFTLCVVNYISDFWTILNFHQLVIKAVIIFILSNIIFMIFTFCTNEFKYGLKLAINILRKNKV